MLKVFDALDQTISYPVHIENENWYLTHKYNGYDTLTLEISSKNEVYGRIAEESVISDEKNYYLVKNMDEHGETVTIECDLDLSAWRIRFWRNFRMVDSTIRQVFDSINPGGWIMAGDDKILTRKTLELSEGKGLENVTSEAILLRAMDVYDVAVRFDVIHRVLHVIDTKEYQSSGDFFSDEVNVRSVGFVGNSKDFATRLYAYGKVSESGEPLTFASINNGKEYVDNFQYCDKIVSVGWSDERYTIQENLLADAKKKLDLLSYPSRSYECDVRNLNQDIYLHKVITLIDRNRKTRIDHSVVEYKEYPLAHDMDVVTLSATQPKIEGFMKSMKADIKGQGTKSQQIMTDAVMDAVSIITGVRGGHVLIQINNSRPESLYILDTDSAETARKVFRLGKSGIEYSRNGMKGVYCPVVNMEGERITLHDDGSRTQADQSGLKRCNGTEEYNYHYLAHSGSVIFETNLKTKHIQLPDTYKNKDISVYLSVKELMPAGDTDVLQNLSSDWIYNKVTGVLSISAECKMLNVQNLTATVPAKFEISYTVIA